MNADPRRLVASPGATADCAPPSPSCSDVRRRRDARADGWSGIDTVTIADDGVHLAVILFGPAPTPLEPANFRLDGGSQVTGIHIVAVDRCPDDVADGEVCLTLTLDRTGDASTCCLCIVAVDHDGHPLATPPPGFDPRSSCHRFSFRQNCAALLDCVVPEQCDDRPEPAPVIDYLAKDYDSFRQAMLDRLSLIMPGWTERHVPDMQLALVELLAYAGDELSYLQDAVGTEAYLGTARLRTSLRRHARLVDYHVHDGSAARAFVCVTASETVVIPADDIQCLAGSERFEVLDRGEVSLRPAHNHLEIWTWGDGECCLPVGTIGCVFVDRDPAASDQSARVLALEPGDVVVFEEVVGARSGLEADADRTHRHVVRLTAVDATRDDVYGVPLLAVEWAPTDALPFALCVTARGGPDCAALIVGVGRGNVVLVEHGGSITWCGGHPKRQSWPVPPPDAAVSCCPPSFGCWCGRSCADVGCACEADGLDGGRPTLTITDRPVTHHAPYPDPALVAVGQARRLRGVPERAAQRLRAMLAGVAAGVPLDDAGRAYLRSLFGAKALQASGIGSDDTAGLRWLLARFQHLLATALRRLDELAASALSGYVLRAAVEAWEIGQTWGADEGAALDPQRRAFAGPASSALSPDPRLALPVITVTADGDDGHPWVPAADMLGCGPTDRRFVAESDDDGVLTLRFGDGRAGAVPPPGAELEVTYRLGNGAAGNVGPDAIDAFVCCQTKSSGITAVRNPLAAAGGSDPEPAGSVRRLAPLNARHRLQRAVTAVDYAAIAGEAGAVQRAVAALRWNGAWSEAHVAVDAFGAEAADDTLLGDIAVELEPKRRIGHDLTVRRATLVPIILGLCVRVDPTFIAAHVRETVLEALGAGRLAGGRLGLFHPDSLTFGEPVRVSVIVATVAGIRGVVDVRVTALRRQFGEPDDSLAAGVLQLGIDEIAQLDNDATHPERGLLDVTIAGGR